MSDDSPFSGTGCILYYLLYLTRYDEPGTITSIGMGEGGVAQERTNERCGECNVNLRVLLSLHGGMRICGLD